MSRVTLHFDDDTKIDFNDAGDALFHVTRQGSSGVVGLRDEDGKNVWTRQQIDARVRRAAERGLVDPDDIRNLAEEG